MNTVSEIFVEAAMSCRWQVLMFIVTGIAFELLIEWAKAIVRQVTGKSTSLVKGTVMGLIASTLYILAAYWAYKGYGGQNGWAIIGTPYFLWVWFILFYFWQYAAIKIAKPVFKKFFPTVNDPQYVKPVKEKSEKKTNDLSEDQIAEIVKEMLNGKKED